jgi:hypothetical protein
MTLTGKSMFMAKKGGSIGQEYIPPKPTGYEGDYERVERDEQTDDYAGFPRPCE